MIHRHIYLIEKRCYPPKVLHNAILRGRKYCDKNEHLQGFKSKKNNVDETVIVINNSNRSSENVSGIS